MAFFSDTLILTILKVHLNERHVPKMVNATAKNFGMKNSKAMIVADAHIGNKEYPITLRPYYLNEYFEGMSY